MGMNILRIEFNIDINNYISMPNTETDLNNMGRPHTNMNTNTSMSTNMNTIQEVT
jgi:hypothetical protein